AQQYSIALGLWRLLPNRRMMLAGFIEDSRSTRIHMTIGQRLPRLMGGVGRAIAAELRLDKEEMREEFDSLAWRVPPSFEEYERDVAQAREHGYARDSGNFAPGVCTVATIIKDLDGQIRFGLSGIMFHGQHAEDAIDRIGQGLVEMSKNATLRLGGLT
ncbi:MAG: IclR family transcriptional regulator C-terminal domain-containing protein, partial [Sphingobium sp.]